MNFIALSVKSLNTQKSIIIYLGEVIHFNNWKSVVVFIWAIFYLSKPVRAGQH